MRLALPFLPLLILARCTEKDRGGRVITGDESAALRTCNGSVGSKLPMLTSGVNAAAATFVSDKDQIAVAWDNKSGTGVGTIVCFVSRRLGNVIGFNIDGVQVQP